MNQVRWNRSTVIGGEAGSDVMTRWPHFGGVKLFRIFDQLFHSITVRNQDFAHICFRPRRFREPPNRIDGIFGSDFSFVDPFDRAGKLGWVMPEKLFGKISFALGVPPEYLLRSYEQKHEKDVTRLRHLFPAIREYQRLADEYNIEDIFQNNGGKILQILLLPA